MPVSFSIIIPTYNRAELLRITLETVAALAVPMGWRGDVLVVDNNSPDNTEAVVEDLRSRCRLPLRHVVEMRQGASYSRTRALQEASGEWLIYLDDDIKVSPDWLQGLAEAIRLFHPDVVTGPVFPWFEGTVPPWCNGLVLDSVTSAYSRRGEQPLVLPTEHAYQLPGCNFAVRRSFALEVGRFHPALDRAGEGMLAGGDFEFGMRLVDRGARSVYMPACSIQHLISQKKMSRAGLKERWHGLGVSLKARQSIRGEPMTLRRRARFWLQMQRVRRRARLLSRSSPEAAFRWELEALRLKGLLSGRVDGLESLDKAVWKALQ